MKRLFFFPLLFIAVYLSAQPRVGFLFGGAIVSSVDEMKFLNNPASFGAEIGITGCYSFGNGKLLAEVDALFFNSVYRSRDNDSTISFDDANISSAKIGIYDNTYDYGFSFPFSVSYKIGRFKPYAGVYFSLSLAEERNFSSGMGDLIVGSTRYYSETEGSISKTSSGLLLGCNVELSPKVDIRFSFSKSFNDYVSYRFFWSVNDQLVKSENMSTRINKWGLSLVYTPEWKFSANKEGSSTTRSERKTWLKKLYEE